jgi:hypothetical protein
MSKMQIPLNFIIYFALPLTTATSVAKDGYANKLETRAVSSTTNNTKK